jgi:cation diffusion facilitator CzcD-associated flavoprotein CzcO
MNKELRYVIIGAGMAGILAGIKLLERGETNFVILEKTGALGGTWRDNRYPGLTCDVPSHAYTYSFAPNPEWSSYYVGGPEIRRYFEKVAADFGVMPYIKFNSEVTSSVFDEKTATWTVSVADGTSHEVDVVIAASGVLHHPKIPNIPGL